MLIFFSILNVVFIPEQCSLQHKWLFDKISSTNDNNTRTFIFNQKWYQQQPKTLIVT